MLDLVEDDHEDGEEENGGESDDSQETLVLPGKGDDVGGPQNTPVAPDATNSEPTQNMRELYWKVVHEAQTRIRKANPKMKGAEVLKLARQECSDCTYLHLGFQWALSYGWTFNPFHTKSVKKDQNMVHQNYCISWLVCSDLYYLSELCSPNKMILLDWFHSKSC